MNREKNRNEMTIAFSALAENESFARQVIAAFVTGTAPTLSDVADVKTAVSEAVTNAIVHGYERTSGLVHMHALLEGGLLHIEVRDEGRGIANIQQAMEPFYTTHPEQERSGMGFAVMQTFMDAVEVTSTPGRGTCVRMRKRLVQQP